MKRLHLRGLVAKIPRTRRWRVTPLGYAVMGAALHLNVSGYPGDKCSGNCQYLDSDPVASLQATAIFYRADTMPGDSGSSVYTLVGGTRYVVAAHRGMCSGNSSANCGARITSDRYNQIVSWINSGF